MIILIMDNNKTNRASLKRCLRNIQLASDIFEEEERNLFLSIRFGDVLMDVFHHKDRTYFHKRHLKHKIVIVIFFVFVLIGYYELIASLGINMNL